MIYKIGTLDEACNHIGLFPVEVINELVIGASVLDCEYGSDRDYTEIGGHSIVLETHADVDEIKTIINYETHPCEWATRLGKSNYVSALYILNNDFSIMLFMPENIAPQTIIDNID